MIPDIKISIGGSDDALRILIGDADEPLRLTINEGGGEVLPVYDGATEVTPTDFAQTLNTANKAVKSNIIINPIPSNYGKVSYNGAFLTVE